MFLADETYLLGRACLFFLRSNLRKSFNDSKDSFDGLFFFSQLKRCPKTEDCWMEF